MKFVFEDRANELAYKYKMKFYEMMKFKIIKIQFLNRFVKYMRKITLIFLQTQTSSIKLKLNF